MKKNLSRRDFPILYLLWKWKLMTTSGVYLKFFSKFGIRSAHWHLWKLEKLGYVKAVHFESTREVVWTLTDRGYGVLSSMLPPLRQQGYKSENPSHDLLCMAIQLGNWTQNIPEGCELFTEQELRRYAFSIYPSWVPSYDDTHGEEVRRPDGYWRVSSGTGGRTIALEVERMPKRTSAYEAILYFYSRYQQIKQVVWVVANKAIAKRINDAILENYPNVEMKSLFYTISDVSKSGWDARCFLGPHIGVTLQSLLEGEKTAQKVSQTPITQTSHTCLTPILLDTRKSPTSLTTYKSHP